MSDIVAPSNTHPPPPATLLLRAVLISDKFWQIFALRLGKTSLRSQWPQKFLATVNGVKSAVLKYFNFPWLTIKFSLNFHWTSGIFPDMWHPAKVSTGVSITYLTRRQLEEQKRSHGSDIMVSTLDFVPRASTSSVILLPCIGQN